MGQAQHAYRSEPMTHSLALMADGLNWFSRFPFSWIHRVRWAQCNGYLGAASDCMADKGFSFGELTLAPGVSVDVYNLHAEAGGSERDIQRSLELDPNNSVARNLYANLLFATGRIEEEVVERRAAARLDPLTPQLPTMVGYALLAAGRAAEALDAFREAVELDTLFWASRAGLGDYHGAMGEHEDALREHRRAAALAPTHVIARSNLARALAESGRRDDALPLIAALRAEGERRGLFDPATAFAMLAVGDEDGALAWLERAYRQKHPQLRLMRRLSERGLADDPRYLDLLRRIGLPPPSTIVAGMQSSTR